MGISSVLATVLYSTVQYGTVQYKIQVMKIPYILTTGSGLMLPLMVSPHRTSDTTQHSAHNRSHSLLGHDFYCANEKMKSLKGTFWLWNSIIGLLFYNNWRRWCWKSCRMSRTHLLSFSENIFNFCTMLKSSSSALSRHCKRNLKIRFRLRNYKYWMEHLRRENKSSKSQQRKCSVRYGNCVIIMQMYSVQNTLWVVMDGFIDWTLTN